MHKLENGEVRIFSRNSEDMTSKYPDLIASLPTAIRDSVTSFVMDAEVGTTTRTTTAQKAYL